MKTRVMIFTILLSLLAMTAMAQERTPLAISPGLDGGVAMVALTCPTFSWTAVPWAQSYRIVVFKSNGTTVPAYGDMDAAGVAVLVKDIEGEASSWTPSAVEALASGGEFVWYVQAIGASGASVWSAGRAFKVDAAASYLGMTTDQARTSLKAKGMSEKSIDAYLKNNNLNGIGVVASAAGGGISPIPQGREDEFNTLYGLNAGINLFRGSMPGATTEGNSFFGLNAGRSAVWGYSNCFMGDHAGYSNDHGSNNTFIGYRAGYRNVGEIFHREGEANTFVGSLSGFSNITGYRNVFEGASSGYFNTTGYWNAFFGADSGYRNTTGYRNTFVGYGAGYENTTGTRNVFIGYYSGVNNTIGLANTFFGDATGSGNVTGIRNTYIGYGAGNTNNSGHYNVCIGTYAGFYNTVSNRLYIANTDTTTPLLYGEFDNAKLAVYNYLGVGIVPTQRIHVVGGAYCNGTTWVNASSRDYKENILSLDAAEALETLNGLNPVKFTYKEAPGDPQVGFIAEDVPDLVATQDRKGMSAMDVVAVLTKVVQEQQKVVQEQQRTISDLKDRVARLESSGKEK